MTAQDIISIRLSCGAQRGFLNRVTSLFHPLSRNENAARGGKSPGLPGDHNNDIPGPEPRTPFPRKGEAQ